MLEYGLFSYLFFGTSNKALVFLVKAEFYHLASHYLLTCLVYGILWFVVRMKLQCKAFVFLCWLFPEGTAKTKCLGWLLTFLFSFNFFQLPCDGDGLGNAVECVIGINWCIFRVYQMLTTTTTSAADRHCRRLGI